MLVNDFKSTLAKLTALISNQDADILGIVSFDPEMMNLKFIEVTVRTEHFKQLVDVLELNVSACARAGWPSMALSPTVPRASSRW